MPGAAILLCCFASVSAGMTWAAAACILLCSPARFAEITAGHGAFRTTVSVAASVTLLKHLEKFRAPAIAS